MITHEFAQAFAADWIAAWNNHDLERVLSHYADDFEMQSPYIAQIAGFGTGKLIGKTVVRAYWMLALEKISGPNFELANVLTGVDSVSIYYRSVRGMAAEVFLFGADGLVVKAMAHYE